MQKTKEEKKEFYEKCGNILKIEHVYVEPVPRRNRWNTRRIGNGRYPGFGLIRCYGTTVTVVSKNGSRVYKTYEEVYEYLRQLMTVDS
jgi:hypothetical protein